MESTYGWATLKRKSQERAIVNNVFPKKFSSIWLNAPFSYRT